MLKTRIACVFAICAGLLLSAQSPPFPGSFPAGVFTNRAALDASSGFTPPTIFGANLYAWYYADRGGVTQVAGVVSAVSDQSANNSCGGPCTLAVNNVGPSWGATSFNSQPGITHTHAGNEGLQSVINNINSANTSFFMVGNIAGTSAGATVSYTDGSSDFNSPQNILLNGTSGPTGLNVFQDGVSVSGAISGNGCAGVTLGSGNLTLYSGLTQLAQSATTNTLGSSTTQIFVGFNNQRSPTDFTWGEIIITNNLPSLGQRTGLNNYFNTHWGLSC